MQCLLENVYNFHLKVPVPTHFANKEIKRKSGLHFCFLFLSWKVLSYNTLTIFFWCQKPPAEEISWSSGVLVNNVILPLRQVFSNHTISSTGSLHEIHRHVYEISKQFNHVHVYLRAHRRLWSLRCTVTFSPDWLHYLCIIIYFLIVSSGDILMDKMCFYLRSYLSLSVER